MAAFLLPWVVIAPSLATAAPLDLLFSAMANGSHTPFNTVTDFVLVDNGATATKVSLTESGGSVGVTYVGKTVWLDGVTFSSLSPWSIRFNDASYMVTGDGLTSTSNDDNSNILDVHGATAGVYLDGLGGADIVTGGNAGDVLVGNAAMMPVQLVSQIHGSRSPQASSSPTVSTDGNLVGFNGGWTAFGSANTSNPTDVIVKNMRDDTATNEHRDANGVLGLSGSGQARLSADGTTLVFQSSSALAPNAPGSTVYAASTTSNAIEAVSTSTGSAFANRPSQHPDVSADGRYVVFTSNATNLAAGGDETFADCYLKDRTTGDLTRLSQTAGGGDGNNDCVDPRISPNGDFVVFSSAATDLEASGTHTPGAADVFLWSRASGTLANITGPLTGSGSSNHPDVTADPAGKAVVAFDTQKAMVGADTNGQRDVYRYLGATGAATRVSTTSTGGQVGLASETPSLSGDGSFIAFRAFSDLLVPGDTNGWPDVVVKSMNSGAVALLSRTPGAQANGPSEQPEISTGGDWIVFQSSAASLSSVAGTRAPTDVYRVSNPLVKDTLAGGPGNDTYIEGRADNIVETPTGGTDLVKASTDFTLPANVENLTLMGTAITGNGNSAKNRITGNASNNHLNGGAGNDVLNGGAGGDVMTGGTGDDTYVTDSNTDTVVETSTGGVDTVNSSVNWTLGATLENLTLNGTAPNGSGNSANNRITGNASNNHLNGGAGNDMLNGGKGNDMLNGGAGNDVLVGGPGADRFSLTSEIGTDSVSDFLPGSDRVSFQMNIGDGDLLVEGATTRRAPGGFATTAELVVMSRRAAGLTTTAAAAAIGSATRSYAAGARRIFVVNNGTDTGVFLFVSAGAGASVSAAELKPLAIVKAVHTMHVADFLFAV
jgi:Ca2+-binding RTX toxin-like protein